MKIPKQIKVGGHIYKVQFKRPNDNEKGSSNWGRTFLNNKQIFIDNDIPLSQMEETFLHEILHCCFHEVGLNADIYDKVSLTEEQIINRVSGCLYQVLKDNRLLKETK